jgi:hypothetical protein
VRIGRARVVTDETREENIIGENEGGETLFFLEQRIRKEVDKNEKEQQQEE